MKNIKIACMSAICLIAFGCTKNESLMTPGNEYVISLAEEQDALILGAKATPAANLPQSMFWAASKGSAGIRETAVYQPLQSPVEDGRIFTGRYMTSTPEAYNWYLANGSIRLADNGAFLEISDTSEDYVAGYAIASSSTTPSVILRHILARTGELRFDTQDGYEVSDVSWSISRNVSGTRGSYNIAAGSWTVESASMARTVLTSDSDMFLIPGDYTISVTYTLSREMYSETFTRSGNVSLMQGEVNDITATANGGSAFNVSVSPSLSGWNDGGGSELIMNDYLRFEVDEVPMEGDPATKGTPVSSIASYGSMQLYGYLYSNWGDACSPNYMFAERVSENGTEWLSSSMYKTTVPSGQKLRFFGLAPYSASGVSVDERQTGAFRFSYSSPEEAASQDDLLVGASDELSGRIVSTAMTYSHCLSAIRFNTGAATVTGTVKSITVKGLYTSADYIVGSGWSAHSQTGDRAVTLNTDVTEGSAKALSSGANTLMLIPQTLPSGAVIEAVVSSDGADHTLTASIAGHTWAEGYSYVYSLSFDSIAGMKISVSPTSADVDYGESKDITVTGTPSDQLWTFTTTGSGFTATRIDSGTLRITGTNCSGSDASGTVTLTTQDGKRSADISVSSTSLQESVSLSPATLSIPYGETKTVTATGTFPGGLSSVSVPAGIEIVSISEGTITLKNTTSSHSASTGSFSVQTVLMGKASNAIGITVGAKPETIDITPKTVTIAKDGSQSFTVSGDFDDYTASLGSTDHASVSQSGNTVTVTNGNGTYGSKTVTLTVTTTTQGVTASTDTDGITLTSQDDHVTGYTISDISLSSTSVGAGGGSITVNGGSVTRIWASGREDADYASATLSCPGASIDGRTVSIASLGTQVKDEGIFTITASYSAGGLSATSRTAAITQGENRVTGRTEGSDHSHTRTGDVSYGDKTYVGSKTYGDKSYGSEYVSGTDYGSWSDFAGEYNRKATEHYGYAVDIEMDVEFVSTSGSGDYGVGSALGSAGREIAFGGLYETNVNKYLSSPAATARGTISAWHYVRTPYQQRRERSKTIHYSRDWTRTATQGYERSASQACSYRHQYKNNYTSGAQDASWNDEEKSHTETWTDTGTDSVTGDSGTDWYRDDSSTEYEYKDVYTESSRVEDGYTVVSKPSWLTVSTTHYFRNTDYSVSANSSARRHGTLTVANDADASATCSAEIWQAGRQAVVWVSGWDTEVHEVLNAKLFRQVGGIGDGTVFAEETMEYINRQYISVEEGSGISVAYCNYYKVGTTLYDPDQWTSAMNGTYLYIY